MHIDTGRLVVLRQRDFRHAAACWRLPRHQLTNDTPQAWAITEQAFDLDARSLDGRLPASPGRGGR